MSAFYTILPMRGFASDNLARAKLRRHRHAEQDKFLATSDIYGCAAKVKHENPECPSGWFANENSDNFLQTPGSIISLISDDGDFKAASYIAIDILRYIKDQVKPMGYSWRDIRDAIPVFFAAPRVGPTQLVMHYEQDRNQSVDILRSIMTSFFYEIAPFVASNWTPWIVAFSELMLEDKLQVLESLPELGINHDIPINQRICIIAGLDIAYSEETHGVVKRFLRVVERMFVTNGMGKVLLVCRSPLAVTSLVEDASRVVCFDEKFPFVVPGKSDDTVAQVTAQMADLEVQPSGSSIANIAMQMVGLGILGEESMDAVE
ncbi:hypothetical protein GGS26DRAFT_600672 [Hypomontagnella submonticulosa]|nr:hypothetical protein GGS26DRAFT_600672 [Hypomontagnella submonticulosa]